MSAARKILPTDIIPTREFAAQRKERRLALLPKKKLRRISVGPDCTFYFECFETMLFQVQEMLLIEKAGPEQAPDEIEAYNPLIPQGNELVATVMFEIEDPARRARVLRELTGVEDTLYIEVGGERVRGVPLGDSDRTADDGKTSSVHFIRFTLTPSQIAAWRSGEGQVILGVSHSNYGHMALIGPESRAELATDFV
jgi:hypothetical protein